MTIRNRIASFVWAFAFALFASSCHDPGVFDPLAGVAGNYTLASANGQLPLRYFHNDAGGQTTVDITSGTLSLTKTGLFQEILQYHIAPPSPGTPYDAPVQVDGTYRLDGSTITFTYLPINGPPYSWGGSVGTGTVTYTDPAFVDAGGLTAVYSR
jgi:peptidoglycan hydrolase-like protein with peptidoglycan-binding domain